MELPNLYFWYIFWFSELLPRVNGLQILLTVANHQLIIDLDLGIKGKVGLCSQCTLYHNWVYCALPLMFIKPSSLWVYIRLHNWLKRFCYINTKHLNSVYKNMEFWVGLGHCIQIKCGLSFPSLTSQSLQISSIDSAILNSN